MNVGSVKITRLDQITSTLTQCGYNAMEARALSLAIYSNIKAFKTTESMFAKSNIRASLEKIFNDACNAHIKHEITLQNLFLKLFKEAA